MVLQTAVLQDEREKHFSLFAAVTVCTFCVQLTNRSFIKPSAVLAAVSPDLKQCLFYTSHTVFMPRLRTCTILQSDSDVLSHRIKGGGGKVL